MLTIGEASLFIGDYRESNGVSNFSVTTTNVVFNTKVHISIIIDADAISDKILDHISSKPIEAKFVSLKDVFITDLKLSVSGKDPLTIEGNGWLK